MPTRLGPFTYPACARPRRAWNKREKGAGWGCGGREHGRAPGVHAAASTAPGMRGVAGTAAATSAGSVACWPPGGPGRRPVRDLRGPARPPLEFSTRLFFSRSRQIRAGTTTSRRHRDTWLSRHHIAPQLRRPHSTPSPRPCQGPDQRESYSRQGRQVIALSQGHLL